MVTTEAIVELQRRTAVSSLDAMHALSVSDGDLQRATEYLYAPCSAPKALQVDGSHLAALLAASLIRSGLWFECEQLGRERWRFAVAPAGYTRLLAIHGELSCSRDAGVRSAAGIAPSPRTGVPSC